MEREPVDAVLGLDVDRFTVGVGEHALDRRGDHAVAVGIAKDHHASANYGIADEEAVVDTAYAYGGTFPAVVADLARRDVGHRCSIGILSRSTRQFYAR